MNINPLSTFREILDTMNDLLDRADACMDEQEKRMALAMKSHCESRLTAIGSAAKAGEHAEQV